MGSRIHTLLYSQIHSILPTGSYTLKAIPGELGTRAMALFRRGGDIFQAFRNNQQVQEFDLPGVTPTGRMLGSGSYGTVEEVSKWFLWNSGADKH
jgi:hypothetical protein